MTKKLLVPYSDTKGPAKGKVFVAPVWDGQGGVKYVSLPGETPVAQGMSVFVGTEITVPEFMVRLVDCGFRISPTYLWQEDLVARYLEAMRQVKIGHVVQLLPDPDGAIRFEPVGRARPDLK